jgi:hypothetical protein
MKRITNDVPVYAYTILIVLVLFGILVYVSRRRCQRNRILSQPTA